MKLSYFRKKY